MPRAGLTPERIIGQAATVADEVGLDRLTLAAVAQRCGVSLPGLYKHVSGLEEVKRGISIAARLFSTGVSTVPLCAIHKAEKDYRGRDGD